jgi:hypothetical protein
MPVPTPHTIQRRYTSAISVRAAVGLHVKERGLIYDSASRPAGEQIACCTSLLPIDSAIWLAGFQIGPEKHSSNSHIRICRSADNGSHWTPIDVHLDHFWEGVPGSLTLGEMVQVQPGRVMIAATWFDRSEPNRPLFDPVTEGILKSKQLIAFSSDKGETWTKWKEAPTPGLTGCAISGPILNWPDGRTAVSFESFKGYDDPRDIKPAAWLLPLANGNATFHEPVMVTTCPSGNVCYWDQRLCVGNEPGEFFGFYWTHDRVQKKDLTVHACRGTLSEGNILNFERWATSLPGQIAAPLVLPDGRLLAAVVDRRKPAEIRLWSSSDGGRTWPPEQSIVIYSHEEFANVTQGTENVDFKKYWEDFVKWSFGHPAMRLLDESHVLLAYYAGKPTCISGHWAKVAIN